MINYTRSMESGLKYYYLIYIKAESIMQCNDRHCHLRYMFSIREHIKHSIYLYFVGYKYVFQPNLNRATCNLSRYQPFIFETDGSSDCTFLKSICNSQGQMTYENGSTTVDRTCICNTDKGYTFVRNPKNNCSCEPSTEDCSCYIGTNKNIIMIDLKGEVKLLEFFLL